MKELLWIVAWCSTGYLEYGLVPDISRDVYVVMKGLVCLALVVAWYTTPAFSDACRVWRRTWCIRSGVLIGRPKKTCVHARAK